MSDQTCVPTHQEHAALAALCDRSTTPKLAEAWLRQVAPELRKRPRDVAIGFACIAAFNAIDGIGEARILCRLLTQDLSATAHEQLVQEWLAHRAKDRAQTAVHERNELDALSALLEEAHRCGAKGTDRLGDVFPALKGH